MSDSHVPNLLRPEGRVLSTLERDGSRRWLHPRLSHGSFLNARRAVAYLLIVIFTAVPYLSLRGKPLILLDVIHREFTILGFTFLPTDTVLLALALLGALLTVFLLTALLGRVWCGWACPQTVYMEFVYRPIERLCYSSAGRGGKPPANVALWRRVLRLGIYLLLSIYLAHTFLAYFVGVEALAHWIRSSPAEHPAAFLVMIGTTALMMFDFTFFREQLCIIACPYGRFQSVLLDRHSLIVGYDKKRGEPRGKVQRNADKKCGDCVDCGLCVTTCPTGIDIRQGLQMECIGCAQCVDACDAVMTKLNRPTGLIRYSSQATMEGAPRRLLRPRAIIYPALLLVIATALLFLLASKQTADVVLLRNFGLPFTQLQTGEISNAMRLKITARSREAAQFSIEIVGEPSARVVCDANPMILAPGESRTEGLMVIAPRKLFVAGAANITLRVTDGRSFTQDIPCRLLGPAEAKP